MKLLILITISVMFGLYCLLLENFSDMFSKLNTELLSRRRFGVIYLRNKAHFPTCIELDYKFIDFDILVYKDIIINHNQIFYTHNVSMNCFHIANNTIVDRDGFQSLEIFLETLYNQTLNMS